MATAASALAARTPTPEERRRSEEVRRQQDASARDAGDAEVEEVDADGYRYARLGFLETCTRRGGRTLVDGKVSRFNKGVKILTYGFQDKVLVLQDHPTHNSARPELFNANFQTGSKRTSRGSVDACAEVVGGPASGAHGHSAKSGRVHRRQRVRRR